MLKNMVEPDGPQMTVWRMGIACWIIKATDAHSEYIIQYLLVLHDKSGRTQVSQCYVLRALPVLFFFNRFNVLLYQDAVAYMEPVTQIFNF